MLSRRPVHHHATQYLPCSYHLGSKCDDSTLLTNCTQARHCHVPMNVGASQTGKTAALQCALSLLGCHRHTFYSRGTKEAYLQKCCSLTLPVGCDNPQSSLTTGQLIVELFNGAKCTLVKSGDKTPTTSCIIFANFNIAETAK